MIHWVKLDTRQTSMQQPIVYTKYYPHAVEIRKLITPCTNKAQHNNQHMYTLHALQLVAIVTPLQCKHCSVTESLCEGEYPFRDRVYSVCVFASNTAN